MACITMGGHNERKRSIWTRRWTEQREKHGAYHSLVTAKSKQTKIDEAALGVLHILLHRAGCYSDWGCANCCATQEHPMTDVQQSRSKVAQQKSIRVPSGLDCSATMNSDAEKCSEDLEKLIFGM